MTHIAAFATYTNDVTNQAMSRTYI